MVALMLVASGTVWASGLAIPEQGAAALSMSAAMTARNEDLSAIFYNPAGIDYVEGVEVYAGLTPIVPIHEYSPFREDIGTFDSEKANTNVYLPPQLYAAWRARENWVLGIGIFTPYGLGTDWDEDWTGRYTSTYGEIQMIFVNPTVAYKVNDQLSIGVGASYISSSATIEKMIDTGTSLANAGLPVTGRSTTYDSKFGLEGDGSAWGFNAGVLYRPFSHVQLGVSYRSAFEMEYDGDAKFRHASVLKDIVLPAAMGGNAYNVALASMPATQSGTATLKMPWTLNVGFKVDATEKLDFSAEFDYIAWSTYEELVVDFDKDLPVDKQIQDKDWDDSVVVRGGTSYDLNEKTVLRFGLMYDWNPVPDETIDPQLPDANRIGVSLGAGYTLGKVRLDAGYMLLSFKRREKDNGAGFSTDVTGDGEIDRFDTEAAGNYPVGNGMYDSYANLFSVSASYAF